MEKQDVSERLIIFKNKLRVHIIECLNETKGLTSKELLVHLENHNIKSNKPTVYRHLNELEENSILIHKWELTKPDKTRRATKRYMIKPDKKQFLNGLGFKMIQNEL